MTETNTNQAKLIYVLYLAGFITGGVTSLIGVVMAYMARGDADEMLKSHYTWQIRTFWIALVASLVGGVLTIVLIGFLVLLGLAVWLIVRCVKGFQQLEKGEPIEDVESWLV
ncbi:MAG: hypothetical protein NXH85_07470 [Pseudomonadaceae bacterium]|nr:hypothetical protein [Pseudomonadaceae bacterium]